MPRSTTVPRATAAQRRLATLFERAAAGDGAAFSAVYALTFHKLRATVATILGDTADTDDALQDAYLRIWNNAWRYDRNTASPMTWMITVARNVAIDRFRQRRAAMVPIEQVEAQLVSPPCDPFERERTDSVELALKAMRATLAPDRIDLLSRAYLQEKSRSALSEEYGVPVGTIKTWIRRSVAEVRRNARSDAALIGGTSA